MSIKHKQKPHSSCSVFLSQYYFGYLGFFVCIKIVKNFALILWRMSLLIWLELHWISRLLWVIYSCSLYWFFQSKNTHVHYIDSSNPRTQYISPSVYVLFDFFHQYFLVFLSTSPFHKVSLVILLFSLQW